MNLCGVSKIKRARICRISMLKKLKKLIAEKLRVTNKINISRMPFNFGMRLFVIVLRTGEGNTTRLPESSVTETISPGEIDCLVTVSPPFREIFTLRPKSSRTVCARGQGHTSNIRHGYSMCSLRYS